MATKLLEQLNKTERTRLKLTDLFEIDPQYGYTESASKEEVGPRFLRITDIQGNTVNWGSVPYCKISENEKRKYLLKKGDLVFARTGATTGMSYFIDADLKEDAVFASYLIRLRFNKNICVPQLLKYFFQSRNYWGQVNGSLSGSAQPGINAVILSEMEVNLPVDLPTQKKIAEILSAYDEKIENNNLIIKNLEAMAQTLFNEWFVKFRFPGHEKAKFVESEIGKIPEGWGSLELRDVFTFVKGKKPAEVSETKKDGFLQQILIDSFENGKKLYADKRGMIVASNEDLLMVMDGASSGRVEFGIEGIVGSTMSKLQLIKPVRSILYFFLKKRERDIKENATGSAIPHTDKEKVYRYKITLPKDANYFERALFRYIQAVERLKHENLALKQSRDRLLARLI